MKLVHRTISGQPAQTVSRALIASLATVLFPLTAANAITTGVEEGSNMDLVGHADLQGRSAYQPLPHLQNGRWIAYVGHHAGSALNPLTGQVEQNGTSIVDVTDPEEPVQLAHIPAQGGAQFVQVCDGSRLPKGDGAKTYLLRTNGDSGHEIWDVTTPSSPTRVTVITSDLGGTHKNWWECDTGIAYLVAGLQPEGWQTDRGLKIYDLSDPANPRFLRNYGLFEDTPGQPGARTQGGIHEATVLGGRVYVAYGVDENGIVQILDRQKLLEGDPAAENRFAPTQANLEYPIIGQFNMEPSWGGHTAFPLIGLTVPELEDFNIKTRDFMAVVSEATANECREATHHMVFFVDITDPAFPMAVSNYHVPEAGGDFCSRGGRFGAHASNWSYNPAFYKKVLFFSYFNAGARAVDVRDPFAPREVGYFIPATTDKTDPRCVTDNGTEECKVAIQTNNVELDDRNYLYLADRANTGLHIVRLTGELKTISEEPTATETTSNDTSTTTLDPVMQAMQ